MSKVIDFEQHKPVLLTRIADSDLFLDAYEDSDGQKYIAMPSAHGLSFIPLFEDGKQLMAYEKKYGGIKRKYALSQAQAVGMME